MVLDVAILGPLELRVDGCAVAVAPGKQRVLLSLLVVRAPASVSTDAIVDALWPRSPPGGGLRALQVTVSRLRRSLGVAGAALETVPSGYRLAVPRDALDAERFERLIERAERAAARGDPAAARRCLEEALELWRGPPLADAAGESFAQAEILRLEELHLVAQEQRIAADLALGRHAMVVGDLERLAAEHPSRERLLRQLMVALYHCGRQADALAAYRDGRRRLDDELGLALSAPTRELEAAILRQDPSLLTPTQGPGEDAGRPAQGTAPVEALQVQRRAAPAVPADPFIGRERELRALGDALVGDRPVRLLSVTGPGGVGKTRLALELARRLAGQHSGGALVVGLAQLAPIALEGIGAEPVGVEAGGNGDPVQAPVVAAVAQALGLREQRGRSLTSAVLERLGDEPALVVLDNFEHVVAAAGFVAALLSGCPRLSLLVTSREALRLPGEREYPLAPLDVPDGAALDDPARVIAADAVALFADRARAVRPGFVVSVANAADVGELCRRLDGLPLALELAAARIKALSPAAMLERLQQRLAVLGAGARTAPARQRTLDATVGWSYDLLPADQQRAFARLSVFSGGFTLAAAEQVCGAALDAVGSLIDKSLLGESEDRYFMLQTIREYAQARLAAGGEHGRVARAHAAWVAELVERAEPHLYGRDHAPWLRRLDHEHDNVRAALDFTHHAGEHETHLRILAACWYYWYLRGHYAEALARLEAGVAGAAAAEPGLRRRLLNGLFVFHWYQGHGERAAALAAESLALRPALPADAGLLRSLINSALAAAAADDMPAATGLLEECISLAGTLDEPWSRAVALTNLADAELIHGRYADAAAHAGEASEIYEQVGDVNSQATCLANLAAAELELGEQDAAVRDYRQALTQMREDPWPDACVYAVDGLAAAAARASDARLAARLIGVVDAIAASTDFALLGFEQARRERTLAAISRRLDDRALAHERADGAALALPAAIAYVLEATGRDLAAHHAP
jgi:predicted ATPase/DNA-binding SARP family transcriptional activator